MVFEKREGITYPQLISSYIGYGRIVDFDNLKPNFPKYCPIYKINSSMTDENSKWFVGEFHFSNDIAYSANSFIEIEMERESEVKAIINQYTNLEDCSPYFTIVNFLG